MRAGVAGPAASTAPLARPRDARDPSCRRRARRRIHSAEAAAPRRGARIRTWPSEARALLRAAGRSGRMRPVPVRAAPGPPPPYACIRTPRTTSRTGSPCPCRPCGCVRGRLFVLVVHPCRGAPSPPCRAPCRHRICPLGRLAPHAASGIAGSRNPLPWKTAGTGPALRHLPPRRFQRPGTKSPAASVLRRLGGAGLEAPLQVDRHK